MTRIWQAFMVGSAVTIAYLLFNLGIKKIVVGKRERKGLFMTTLFIMLGFISQGCNAPKTYNVTDKVENKMLVPSFLRILILSHRQEWNDLKMFLKELRQADRDRAKVVSPYKISEPIKEQVEKHLSVELARVTDGLSRLAAQGLIKNKEFLLITESCKKEIQALQTEEKECYECRLVIPLLFKEDTIFQQMDRLKMIRDLKSRAGISASEQAAAAYIIKTEIETIYSNYLLSFTQEEILDLEGLFKGL
ncbi:MAG: hypothetical protein HQL16_02925 [Candidatus Omnitrophica bacterium]|nr:hypothetical protein [Candidatus Omnitrophota bacterium]